MAEVKVANNKIKLLGELLGKGKTLLGKGYEAGKNLLSKGVNATIAHPYKATAAGASALATAGGIAAYRNSGSSAPSAGGSPVANKPAPSATAATTASAPLAEPSLWEKLQGYGNDAMQWAKDNPGYTAAGIGVPLALYLMSRRNDEEKNASISYLLGEKLASAPPGSSLQNLPRRQPYIGTSLHPGASAPTYHELMRRSSQTQGRLAAMGETLKPAPPVAKPALPLRGGSLQNRPAVAPLTKLSGKPAK